MKISDSGMQVLERRYLKRDDDGNIIETPEQLFRRVAHTVAGSELAYVSNNHPMPLQVMKYWEDKFYQIMTDLDFLPNSPTLMNAGLPLGQLSACFVLPIEDSIDEIFMRVHDTAMIHKSGGGTGFSFSRIRPDGAMVSTTKGKASGPLSFMHAFDAATGTIAQGGKRRGANMGMLRIDHPDILKFIQVKNDLTQLNNFNLSVAVTERFMTALRDKTQYELIDPHTGKVDSYMDAELVWNMIIESAWKTGEPGIIFIDRVNEFNFLKPLYGEIEATNPCLWGGTKITINNDGEIQEYPIRDLVDTEVRVWTGYEWSAVIPRKTGENQKSLVITTSIDHKVQCTLYHKFLMADATRKEAQDLRIGDELYNWIDPRTGEIVNCRITGIEEGSVLDEVFCLYEPIRHTFMANGVVVGNCGEQPLLPWEACNLGSINLANFVLHTEMPAHNRTVDYARLQEVVNIATRFLDDVIDANKYPLPQIDAMCKSTRKIGLGVMGFADMLHLLQVPYNSEEGMRIAKSVMQTIQDSAHHTSLKLTEERGAYPAYYELDKLGIDMTRIPRERNAAVTTIAPTGSISAIAGVSSGIEPLFANVFYKNVMDNTYLPVVNEHLMNDLRQAGVYTMELEEKIKKSETIAHFEEIPQHLRDVYVCAHDISPVAHVQMQATFQQYVDNAISKTVNFNEDATQDDIRNTYNLAYQLGCKGITVYRNNCRKNQVLNVGTVEKKDEAKSEAVSIPDVEFNPFDKEGMLGSIVHVTAGPNLCKILADDEEYRELVQQAHDVLEDALNYMVPGDIQRQKRSVEKKTLDPDLVFRAVCEFANNDGEARKWGTVLPVDVIRELRDWCIDHLTVRTKSAEGTLSKTYDPDKNTTKFYGEFLGDMEHFVGKTRMTDEELAKFIQSIAGYYRPGVDADGVIGILNMLATTKSTDSAIRPRPEELSGKTKCVPINCGKLYVTVNHDERNKLFEVFTTNGKGGGCPAQSEAVCRLASLLLRSGVPVEAIIRQLRGIKCTACLKNPNIHVLSCPDAIGRELEAESKKLTAVQMISNHAVGIEETKPVNRIMSPFNEERTMPNILPDLAVSYQITAADSSDEGDDKSSTEMHEVSSMRIVKGTPDGGTETLHDEVKVDGKDVCPQCGAEMQHVGGCVSCNKCGYSNCG